MNTKDELRRCVLCDAPMDPIRLAFGGAHCNDCHRKILQETRHVSWANQDTTDVRLLVVFVATLAFGVWCAMYGIPDSVVRFLTGG